MNQAHKSQKVRWLIAHEPVHLFLRTAKAFASDVLEKTKGQIDIEIYTLSEYAEKFGKDRHVNPLTHMENGDLEMSQLHISQLWKYNAPAFMALELPFLFRDHDHASRVLEGQIGKTMLETLKEKSPARGLAFTYSGGYRVMLSKNEIKNLSDFKNLKFYTGTNPIGIDTIEAIGGSADANSADNWWATVFSGSDEHDAVDTTLPRVAAAVDQTEKRYLTDTRHSMFLTTIIVSEKWWNNLPDELKLVLSQSATDAARLERNWSIEDSKNIINNSQEHGLYYKELSSSDMEKFRTATKHLYKKYNSIFMPGLIDNIQNS